MTPKNKRRSERNLIMFEPGVVYLVYGENCYVHRDYAHISHAYKIGATRNTPEGRIQSAWSQGWEFRRNMRLLHTIYVDNMRVVEMMFHERFTSQSVIQTQDWCEWFLIDDEVPQVCAYKSIRVTNALADLSGDTDPRVWWKNLTPAGRRNTAVSLWHHPDLQMVCSVVGNGARKNRKTLRDNSEGR